MMEDPYSALMGGGGQPTADDENTPPVEHLRMAIEHAQAAQVGEPDDADSEKLAKLVAGLYQILANRQKETDKVMGDPTLLRTLRRSGS